MLFPGAIRVSLQLREEKQQEEKQRDRRDEARGLEKDRLKGDRIDEKEEEE